MSSTSTRKSFIAKLGGLVAATGLMPGAVVKAGTAATPPATPVKIRAETRAVARGSSSL